MNEKDTKALQEAAEKLNIGNYKVSVMVELIRITLILLIKASLRAARNP